MHRLVCDCTAGWRVECVLHLVLRIATNPEKKHLPWVHLLFFFFFRKSWQILETVQTLTVTRGPMQADNTTVMVAEGWPLLSVASRVQRCDTNQTPSPNGKKQHFGRHEVATELRSFLNRSMSALHQGVKSLLLLPIVTPLIRWSVFLVDATNKRNAWRNKLLN